LRVALPLLAALSAGACGAHEFWMLPDAFALPAGASTRLTLAVGQDFAGEPVAFSRQLVADLRHLARDGDADLRLLTAGNGGALALRLRLAREGTHVIALDTRPSAIELQADKFNDYLRLEGLGAVLQARERAGAIGLPGREHYRRNVKTIVQSGGLADATFARRTGQRLELVPLANPAGVRPGEALSLQLWFDDQPLEDALVKLWNGSGADLLAPSARTDAAGKVSFILRRSGTWMASVVHMIPARDAADHDWDSYWGNLTFALPAAAQDDAASGALRR
jgi:hypothetical protein